MRKSEPYRTAGGEPRWKVRYRSAGVETSETFRRVDHANTFAALLASAPGQQGVSTALAWLAGLENAATSETFGQWFESYVDQLTGVTPRTRDDYRAQHRRYLTHLDRIPITLLTRSHVTSLVNGLEADGLSPKTIKNVVNMLSSSLSLAVDDGHIGANPCRRIRLPRPKHDANEARFLTYTEFATVLAQIPDHYKPLVVFLVGTGLRWSEATALQSRHVDIDAGTVRVQQAWKRIEGGFELGPPKTPKARRTVNAATMALAAVAPLLGKANAYVFTTPTGRTVSHSNFYNRIWAPAVKRADVQPRPRIHDLRHTHASWLISSGQSLEAVQDQLGHESILTTRAVYGHLQPALGAALGRAASEALERALPGGLAALPALEG